MPGRVKCPLLFSAKRSLQQYIHSRALNGPMNMRLLSLGQAHPSSRLPPFLPSHSHLLLIPHRFRSSVLRLRLSAYDFPCILHFDNPFIHRLLTLSLWCIGAFSLLCRV